ncbi:septal ring lytic transglycosylase RlpA family protein [Aestuariivirga litoralis]|uniref:septal ring lytic transglycosylase RlpA family protein n=1 Tax=Aestuariivirga litoralis TaxID=2650924 RepID=UPI0018C6E2E0|nr:septal ring lytic transglycosylase RlpA family protein [Aestuariivirga litoralis]MBG1232682.1 septal ring lytic transglycosylase RlpA family protein [Aestuariivirga litoralis]
MKLIASAAFAVLLFASTAHASVGYASWYKMGRVTANGERFKPMGFTCAHRSLRFGTKLKVTNLKNGRSIVVRVNDRGPFVRGRVMDLSMGAARAIGVSGVAKISYVVMN